MVKKKVVKEVTEILARNPEEPRPALDPNDALSTGSTLLNLAMSGMPQGGLFPGMYYLWVGDSGSGKTKLTLTVFAEATRNPRFDDYLLIHDNAENGALMDLSEHFGKRVEERVQPPKGTKSDPVYSETVQDFYRNVDRAIAGGTPFIYVLDSMDAIDTEEDQDHFDKSKKPKKEGEERSGNYGTAKAKANSAGLRRACAGIRDTGSILIIISHAKMNIGRDAMFRPKSRSGGTSLKYFAHVEMWTSVYGQIKKKVRGKDRIVETSVLAAWLKSQCGAASPAASAARGAASDGCGGDPAAAA